MGSVMRGGTAPFAVARGWIVEPRFAPEAGEIDNPLYALTEAEVEAMISGAGLQLMEHQTSILPLLVDEPGIARAMRFGWNEIRASAQQGRLAEVLPPSAPVAALAAIDPALWDTL